MTTLIECFTFYFDVCMMNDTNPVDDIINYYAHDLSLKPDCSIKVYSHIMVTVHNYI